MKFVFFSFSNVNVLCTNFRLDLVIERERKREKKESQLTTINMNNYADFDCKIILCTLFKIGGKKNCRKFQRSFLPLPK